MYLHLTPLLFVLSLKASASPIHQESAKGSFSVEVTHHRKVTGQGRATNVGDDWTVEMTIGPQVVVLLVDTGSADLWVASTDMPLGEQSGLTAPVYNPHASPTFRNITDSTFDISYGGGMRAYGYVGTDRASIGNAVVSEMPIEVAVSKSGSLGNVDGFLGLGFKALSSVKPRKVPTFMELVQSSLDQPVFTTNFKRASDNAASTLGFGHVDRTLYTGKLVTLPVNNGSRNNDPNTGGQWTIDRVSYSANGQKLGSSSQGLTFDSGGINIILDVEVARNYYSRVPSAVNVDGAGSLWIFNCSLPLPDLTLEFSQTLEGTGPARAIIPGSELNNNSSPVGNGSCRGSIYGYDGFDFIGAPFFLQYFTVFNQAVPSFAFAPQA